MDVSFYFNVYSKNVRHNFSRFDVIEQDVCSENIRTLIYKVTQLLRYDI